jgi:hypothetical protein
MTTPSTLAAAAMVALSLSLLAPTPQQDLVGGTFDAVLAKYGPPDSGYGLAGGVAWHWRDASGGRLVVTTYHDTVVCVDRSRTKGEVELRTVPSEGAYPGQTLAELLQRLGAPSRATPAPARLSTPHPVPMPPGTQALTSPPIADIALLFGERTLLLSGGRVLGDMPTPQPARGPR